MPCKQPVKVVSKRVLMTETQGDLNVSLLQNLGERNSFFQEVRFGGDKVKY